ncbi:galactokinase [Marmoricola endophyticus]|uniref:Galactokinase n=1 Tax=Marmoricola endophyticus TaxID=2040280 RepID=A0A917F101_9ACTN|nr:galactokinase [Marmoricola endophyticus]GGF34108.1 galactokinase [Marmoricola endophyticus]
MTDDPRRRARASADPEWVRPWSDAEGRRAALETFRDRYDDEPDLVAAAPGRVNLIGEHTDYNDGLCLPLALPHSTYVAIRRRDDDRVVIASGLEDGAWTGALDDLGTAEGWPAYVAGVAWALGEAGFTVPGFEIMVESTVPLGAGLSSSAALECATGTAVLALLDVEESRETRMGLARAGIRAENEVAGAATGGMDQTVAVLGSPAHALLLDCRSWETELIPFDPAAAGLELLVVDTRAHHQLNDGAYESRRRACERAAAAIGVDSLRNATPAQVDALEDAELRSRARHVVTEIARVAECADVLRSGSWDRVGELMSASHVSMRDDFEISCPELDLVVDTATARGALGARMTGGGFGGSAIALVRQDDVPDTARAITEAFAAQGYDAPGFLPAPASAPARVLPALHLIR